MRFQDRVSRGQQVGIDIDFDWQGELHWLQMAIQFYEDKYISHIMLIDEKNIAGENFKIYKTTMHESLERAMLFLKLNSPVDFNFDDFKPKKGQNFFSPEDEDIIAE